MNPDTVVQGSSPADPSTGTTVLSRQYPFTLRPGRSSQLGCSGFGRENAVASTSQVKGDHPENRERRPKPPPRVRAIPSLWRSSSSSNWGTSGVSPTPSRSPATPRARGGCAPVMLVREATACSAGCWCWPPRKRFAAPARSGLVPRREKAAGQESHASRWHGGSRRSSFTSGTSSVITSPSSVTVSCGGELGR